MRKRTASHALNSPRIALLVLLVVCCWQGWAVAQPCCETTIVSYPYVEDFEDEQECSTDCDDACPLSGDWLNADSGDDMDWIVDEYNTPSSSTGPTYDHNPGTSSGNYLYTEASSCDYSTAILYSPCFDLMDLEHPELHFWYSMYGSSMGTMSLEISADDCETWTEVWSLSGDQGNDWLRAVVKLDDYLDQTVRFRILGTTEGGIRSDMAIDDVLLRDVPDCPATVQDYPYVEDFEGEELCSTNCAEACPLSGNWTNEDTDDDMDWIVDEYNTPTGSTGPTYDHNPGTSDGNYLYTEASSCENSTAVLYSPCFDLAGLEYPELHFWYSMYGSSMGSLELEISSDPYVTWDPLWSLSGDQGNDWLRAVVELDGYLDQSVRFRFVGTTGGDIRSDMGIDDILLRDVPCCPVVVTSYPYEEDFEGEELCNTDCEDACPLSGNWTNADTDDDMDWIVDEYNTPSNSTGPTYDHNPGTSDGNYLYTEASDCETSMAVLYSPCFDLMGLENPELHFWYSMYGSSMGTMSLEISEDNCGAWTEIWSLSGDQGNDWLRAVVKLDDYLDQTVRFRFVGTTGDGIRSDMAIDDVLLRDVPNCPATVINYPYVEDFEGEELCDTDCAIACPLSGNWTNADTDDHMDWIVDEYNTPSNSTGPTYDHNPGTSDGNYLYTEASSCENSTAVLYSPCFDLAGLENPELHFWYSMYGSSMGSLELKISSDPYDTWDTLWSLSGDQGNDWLRAVVELDGYLEQSVRFQFVGTTGSGINSDMAIDDILLRDKPCCPDIVASFPYVEDFEGEELCNTDCADACPLSGNWTNADTDDDMDWIVDEYNTPSNSTGPTYDHNPGTSDGNYLYTEASECETSTAVLYSPCFDFEQLNDPQLSFWYSMYGSDMGTMSLEISEDNCGSWTEIWTLTGNQGNDWLQANIDLAAYSGESIRLRFIGTTGGGIRSDMAIDDVQIDGEATTSCSSTVSVYPYSQDFESEILCLTDCLASCELDFSGWVNDGIADDMDWLVAQNATPDPGTGPSGNHTPGLLDGNYLYTESTGCPNASAVLYSPCFNLGNEDINWLTFHYHMYGTGMGTLTLEAASRPVGSLTELWSRSGDQGDVWQSASVDLGGYRNQTVQLRFRGLVGDTGLSDMAIDDISLQVEATGVDPGGLPRAVALHQNVPNPFNPQTEIHFDLPAATKARLLVLDLQGRVVRTLVDGLLMPAGRHRSVWNGRDDRGRQVATGTYLYMLRTSEFVETRRMVLLK